MKKILGIRDKGKPKGKDAFAEAPTVPRDKIISSQEITKPLSPQPTIIGSDQPEGRLGLAPPQLLASCSQSVGKQRDHNEDSIFLLTTMLSTNGTQLPFGLYIVADGMGGHQHGEVASEIATLTMANHVMDKIFCHIYQIDPEPPNEPLREILHTGIIDAHNEILANAPGGGTTLTTVVIMDNQMAIAHVGDSRVYSVNLSGTFKALTRDHSLVKRLEELGQLTPEEAAVHPQRNVLYRALGQGEPFEPEIITAPTPESGYLLICSDGLWGVVPEKELGLAIKNSATLHDAVQEMVDDANEAGGPDNISAILVRLPD
ncbi:MAG: serine/threonine-protein phosphatase [Anaerolineales bacterium]|nr:serine/threonine-protein phosphatase [Anaerolineales bacterium]